MPSPTPSFDITPNFASATSLFTSYAPNTPAVKLSFELTIFQDSVAGFLRCPNGRSCPNPFFFGLRNVVDAQV
jgi:hypothetical protein